MGRCKPHTHTHTHKFSKKYTSYIYYIHPQTPQKGPKNPIFESAGVDPRRRKILCFTPLLPPPGGPDPPRGGGCARGRGGGTGVLTRTGWVRARGAASLGQWNWQCQKFWGACFSPSGPKCVFVATGLTRLLPTTIPLLPKINCPISNTLVLFPFLL